MKFERAIIPHPDWFIGTPFDRHELSALCWIFGGLEGVVVADEGDVCTVRFEYRFRKSQLLHPWEYAHLMNFLRWWKEARKRKMPRLSRARAMAMISS